MEKAGEGEHGSDFLGTLVFFFFFRDVPSSGVEQLLHIVIAQGESAALGGTGSVIACLFLSARDMLAPSSLHGQFCWS